VGIQESGASLQRSRCQKIIIADKSSVRLLYAVKQFPYSLRVIQARKPNVYDVDAALKPPDCLGHLLHVNGSTGVPYVNGVSIPDLGIVGQLPDYEVRPIHRGDDYADHQQFTRSSQLWTRVARRHMTLLARRHQG
jgi:hypothetical protein